MLNRYARRRGDKEERAGWAFPFWLCYLIILILFLKFT